MITCLMIQFTMKECDQWHLYQWIVHAVGIAMCITTDFCILSIIYQVAK